MPKLSESYQVIAIDLPGFGESDKRIKDSFSFRYYCQTISEFLDKLGIDKLTLGVHDLGGPIGLLWLVQNKDRVNRLIFFNTLVYPKFSLAVKLFGLATLLPGINSLLTSPIGIKKVMRFGVHTKDKLTDEAIKNYQAPFIDSQSRKVLLKTVQRLSPKGFEEIENKLQHFKGPVQIIYGKEDKILPDVEKTMTRVKRELPQADVIALNNCGHFLQEELPEEISAILLNFMNKTKSINT